MKNTLVFTGSYTQPLRLGTGQIVNGNGEGITVFRAGADGKLTKLSSTIAPNPTYLALHPSKRRLYCVNELKEYEGAASSAVSAYALDAKTGALQLINRRLTGGEDACNVSLSPSAAHLLAANYTGGSLCVFPLYAEQGIGRPSCFFQHYGQSADPLRQKEPHVHQAIADRSGRHVLVSDLGTDEVALYSADWQKGHLAPAPNLNIRTSPGMGPRLCVFNQTGERLYVITEMGNAVLVYEYDDKTAAVKLLQTISTLPEACAVESIAACVKLHPNGRFLYTSNRGHDSIAVYAVDSEGLLSPPFFQPTGGRTPRDFDISPSGEFLIAGNQESDELVVFSIDTQSGKLTELSRTACGSVTSVLIADIGEQRL